MSRHSGANFCQVAINIALGQDRAFITFGNQWCRGAAPSFNERATIISIFENKVFIIKPNSKSIPPKACAKKYLVAASVSW